MTKIFAIVMAVLFFQGCAGPKICGEERQRVQFYDLYEAAQKAEAEGRRELAICLYKETINRDLWKVPGWRPTYGAWSITDYDPWARLLVLENQSPKDTP